MSCIAVTAETSHCYKAEGVDLKSYLNQVLNVLVEKGNKEICGPNRETLEAFWEFTLSEQGGFPIAPADEWPMVKWPHNLIGGHL